MAKMPEPTWDSPEDVQKVMADPSSLCNMRFKPSIVTGILLRLLQAHYYDSGNIVDEKLKAALWIEDPTNKALIESKINIKPGRTYDPRTIQQRPAILVFRNEISTQRFPLESKTLSHLEANGNYRGENHHVPIIGSHTLRCLAKGAFATDRLSEETFYRMLEYFPAIKRDFPFSEFDVKSIGEPQLIEESGQHYGVDIIIGWVNVHNWTLVPIAPILKKVRMETQVNSD